MFRQEGGCCLCSSQVVGSTCLNFYSGHFAGKTEYICSEHCGVVLLDYVC